MKMWRNRTFLRVFSWPILAYMTFFFVYIGGWDNASRAWAAESYMWNESETPIEFSTDGRGILKKAAELEKHPVLIFEFVRNNIRYEPYRGVRYGAVGALERGRANDPDKSMLLAALLRGAWRNLHRGEPKLWFVQGDVRISLTEAEQWLGVQGAVAIREYLGKSKVPYNIVGNELELTGHVWLRGDLEFGHYRGARFSEANEGIQADLDPTIVVAKSVNELPDPFAISNVQVAEFVGQVERQVVKTSQTATVTSIPEGYLLDVADSGAAQFRRYLTDHMLDMETALENRIPIFESITALPDALPFKMAARPTAYRLTSGSDQLLSSLRQRVQVRWMHKDPATNLNAPLANATIPLSRIYGKPLIAAFTTNQATELQLTSTTLHAAWTNVQGSILLDGAVLTSGGGVEYTQSSTPIPYGDKVDLEFACQLDPTTGKLPLDEDLTEKEIVTTSAGSMFAIGAVNGLNTASADDYTTRMLTLMTNASGPGTMHKKGFSAGQSLGPVRPTHAACRRMSCRITYNWCANRLPPTRRG